MAQTISRMYATRDQAQKALDELGTWPYYGDATMFDGLDPAGEPIAADALAQSMMRAGILRNHAQIFAGRVGQSGSTLLSVRCAFGTAQNAVEVMESFGPIASGVVEKSEPASTWVDTPGAPFSNFLGLPVLTKRRLPFSQTLMFRTLKPAGWLATGSRKTSVLTKRKAFMGFFPLLSKTRAPVSKMLGLPTLMSNRTPFSRKLYLAPLSANRTPLSSLLGLPVLTKKYYRV